MWHMTRAGDMINKQEFDGQTRRKETIWETLTLVERHVKMLLTDIGGEGWWTELVWPRIRTIG